MRSGFENRPVLKGIFPALALGFGLSVGGFAQEAPPPTLTAARHPWNELETSWISVRLGFAALEDGAFYSQDAASKQQVGQLSSEGLFRLDDLALTGQIKFSHPWDYEVSANYKGLDPTDTQGWTLVNLNVSIPLGELAKVTIGKQKEGVGLEMIENARDIPFMEHSVMTTATTFVESHIAGVRFWNSIAAGRMTWSAGWFNNWLSDGQTFSQSGNLFAGRVSGLPVESDGGRRLLHLGLSAVYRGAQNGSFKSKSVPEVYEAPDFVDTGSFAANHATSIAAELAAVQGPVTVSGEYTTTNVSSPQTGNPHFGGYYAMASWALTGETRPYSHASGTFGMISPARPFSFKHGGLGAWELSARYSNIDLTSGTIEGGKFDRISAALSWYPTSQWRLEFNYGYGRLDKSGLEGRTRFYQLRLQFQL